MIHVTCASCSKEYKLPDNTAGRKARCKACGEAMIVPEAPDDLFDDGTPAGDDLTALYSGGHGSEVIDQSDAGEAPLAFDPEAVFQHQPKAVKWEPSFKLIYGSAAAGVGLLVIGAIALLIILTSDGKEDDGPDGLDFDTTAGVPSIGAGAPSADTKPDTDTGDTENPATDPEPDPDPDDLDPPSTGTDPTGDDETTPPDTDDPAVDPDTETDTEPETEGPTEEPGPEVPPAGVLLAPTSSAYAIALPGELEVVSQTRVAIRTAPHADGTWLSMEVHKLAGLDRRAVSPVAEDGSTVLIRGRRVAMPAGVEVSEIATDRYTLTRLLYPKQDGEELRRVEYVVKDGPYLISVLGRYPADDQARLALLDEAAKSVQPAEDQ